MKINFYPDSDKEDLIKAANEYSQIWQELGSRIVEAYKRVTGLYFVEKEINAIIFEKPSFSHPLTLRASYPLDIKKGTLIHELGHRLLAGNNAEINTTKIDVSLKIHKQLFLILFDVWKELFGLEFAKTMVAEERKRGEIYDNAWNWAQTFDKEKRQQLFHSSIVKKTLNS